MTSGNASLMHGAWKTRNQLYLELFGEPAYCLPKGNPPPVTPEPGFRRNEEVSEGDEGATVFSSSLSGQRITVFAYAPSDGRPYWTYVTAGLSNPWYKEEADEVSGFGCELVVKSPTDARWPIRLLRRLAYYILSYSGTLSPGVILNMEKPLAPSATDELNNIFVWYTDEAPDCWYQLPSGGFGLFCAIGVNEEECRYAESVTEYGVWCIQQVLRHVGLGQVTDPKRASIMKRENIAESLEAARNYADNFRSLM